MSVTRTGARLSARAAARPPNPPPTMTTCGRDSVGRVSSGINRRSPSPGRSNCASVRLQPPPEGLVELDAGEEPIAPDLGQRALRREQLLLGLEHLVVAGQP